MMNKRNVVVFVLVSLLAVAGLAWVIPSNHVLVENTICFNNKNVSCVYSFNVFGYPLEKMTIGYYCRGHMKSAWCVGLFEDVPSDIYALNLSNINFTV